MWSEYQIASTVEEVLDVLAQRPGGTRVVAGATDLLLELERGVRTGIEKLVDITRIAGLDRITLDRDERVHLGPLVTHNDCAASELIREHGFPLARAAWEVGAPQIRNRGTVAGNLITASPANDTITPLVALDAEVMLRSNRGERTVGLADFYQGVRKTQLQPDEILVDISFRAMRSTEVGTFVKLALRRAQAISVVNAALKLDIKEGIVQDAAIALGAVAPTIIRIPEAELSLRGKPLNQASIDRAASLSAQAARPIDDIRASAAYRREMVRVCVRRGLEALARGTEREGFPSKPVLLATSSPSNRAPIDSCRFPEAEIETTINGKRRRFRTGSDKNLLRLLREEAGLTGTKEGCAEGECGACTVFLDGRAVMACLVPAARAHHAEVVTIEGLAATGHNVSAAGALHPLQTTFIASGAVQCGYCTPGFIMSGAMLMEEKSSPSKADIEQAFTGNLCRCTGYYNIVEAVERASAMRAAEPEVAGGSAVR